MRFARWNRRSTRFRNGRSVESRASALWEVAFHVAAVAEVFVVLRLLVPDITLTEAFLLESAGRFVTVAFKFVPYRLGIDEAGSGAVASVLGLPPVTGVTLALVRRIRIIVLNAIGLVLLSQTQTLADTDVNHGGTESTEQSFLCPSVT